MSQSLNRMVLERAIKLVESGWTQGTWARKKDGQPCDWDSDAAIAFCAVGALLRATREVLGIERNLMGSFSRIPFITRVEAVELVAANDKGPRETVLAMLRARLEEV